MRFDKFDFGLMELDTDGSEVYGFKTDNFNRDDCGSVNIKDLKCEATWCGWLRSYKNPAGLKSMEFWGI